MLLTRLRKRLPEPVDVIDATLSKIENENDISIMEKFDLANGALFQATRLLFKSQASLIPKIYNIKKEIYKGLKDPSKKDEEGSESQSKMSISVDEKTEQHLEAEIKVLKTARGLILGTNS